MRLLPLICSYNSGNTTAHCVIEGDIVDTENSLKRVALFARLDKDVKILSMTQSKNDKTWILYEGGVTPDLELCLTGFDDSGEFHPDSYDRVSRSDKVFNYVGSELEQLEGKDYLLHTTLISTDRSQSKSFINWLFDIKYQNLNNSYVLTNFIVPTNLLLTGVKFFVFEIENNWGGNYIGIRRVEFYDENNVLYALIPTDYTATATTQFSTSYIPSHTFNTSLPKTGTYHNNQWLASVATKQRLVIVFNTVKNISKIVINNSHDSGVSTTGCKQIGIYYSTSTSTPTTVFESAITGGNLLSFMNELPQHSSTDAIDDYLLQKQDFSQTTQTGVKSVVVDCFDNYGSITSMGIRSIDFYDSTGVRIPLLTTDMTVYYTSQVSTTYAAEKVFLTALLKTGGWAAQWTSKSGFLKKQRITCVFNTVKDIKFMIINNGHNYGESCDIGVKNIKIQFTPDTVSSTVGANYNQTVSNATVVYDGILPIHKSSDSIDNYVIKKVSSGFITDLSNNVIVPANINLENNFNITTNDASFKISGISGNTFNTYPALINDYTSLITEILPFDKTDEKLRYIGTVNSNVAEADHTIPFAYYESITSIQIDEIKKVIGFVEPTPEYGELCIQSGEPNLSTTFTDKSYSNYTITSVGATHSATQYKFSPTSIAFLASGNYLRVVNEGTFNLGVRDFTISYWFYKTTYLANNTHFDIGTNGSLIRNDATNLKLFAPTSATTILSITNPSTNAWHLLTLTRINGTFRLYIDRVLQVTSISTYDTTAFGAAGVNLTIGNYGNAGAYFLNGYMEEFRLILRGLSQAEVEALPDALQKPYVEVQESGTTTTSIYYSVSFDGEDTYKVWTGTVWREIASCLSAVHGNVGDNDWYFRDNASVWSKTGVTNSFSAIGKAIAYANNQMTKTQVNALEFTQFNATGGFVSATGTVGIGVGFISTTNGVGATIQSIDINGNTSNTWCVKKVPVNIATTITSSKITWNYTKSSDFDFESSVVVKTLLTGQTSWNTCSNGGSIVGLTQGLTAENKELYIKVSAPKLSTTATFDPALFILNIEVL